MKRRTAALPALVALLLLFGCAGTGERLTDPDSAYQRHQVLFRAATQYGTLKVIEKNPTLAPKVAELAGTVASEVEAGRMVVVAVVEQEVRARIAWDKLKPEEFILVDALIVSVRTELERAEASLMEKTPGDGEAQKAVMLEVAKVLRWIEQAALMTVAG